MEMIIGYDYSAAISENVAVSSAGIFKCRQNLFFFSKCFSQFVMLFLIKMNVRVFHKNKRETLGKISTETVAGMIRN